MGAHVAFRDRPTTAISRSASTVYSSKPNVLFCDVELNHGESRQFSCEIPLPMHELPPSFRGHLVRYLNRITVAVQHVRAPIKLMHIPVSMTNAKGKVATMTLFKKTFRLGEDVLGILSFEDSGVPCVQYSVHLETVEQLAEDVVGERGEVKTEGMLQENVAVHSNDYVVCAYASESSFRLSIPMHAPPTFHTDTVHLKWRLRFEFVTSEPLINVVYGEVCKAPIGQFQFINF
ncbi:unnamed protein product [Cylicostephanus goldi]|uniref:Rgp1 n=1 Tax=Cylicostephanus goldi TaxID=71465 RepID=A0A3P7P0Y9_CYLGO|nr:unnamed protein product [Cylicostephanus goldi]